MTFRQKFTKTQYHEHVEHIKHLNLKFHSYIFVSFTSCEILSIDFFIHAFVVVGFVAFFSLLSAITIIVVGIVGEKAIWKTYEANIKFGKNCNVMNEFSRITSQLYCARSFHSSHHEVFLIFWKTK